MEANTGSGDADVEPKREVWTRGGRRSIGTRIGVVGDHRGGNVMRLGGDMEHLAGLAAWGCGGGWEEEVNEQNNFFSQNIPFEVE